MRMVKSMTHEILEPVMHNRRTRKADHDRTDRGIHSGMVIRAGDSCAWTFSSRDFPKKTIKIRRNM